jgi:hypothetical protein
MKLSVIVPDNVIVIDGVSLCPEGFVYPEGVRAIQWDGTDGYVEFEQGAQQHFSDEDFLADFVAAHAAAVAGLPTGPDVTPAEMALRQIRALEATYEDGQKKVQRQYLIAALLKEACARPEAVGMSQTQVHQYLMAQGKAYAKLVVLEEMIVPLRELIP